MTMQPRNRIGPVCAIGGAIALFIGTWMHPMNSDPNVAVAAFSEYAAADTWVTGHLMQLLGVTLMTAALLLLLRRLSDGSAAEYVVLATAGAIAGLATAAALQAVDGVALKVMLRQQPWSGRPGRIDVKRRCVLHCIKGFRLRSANIAHTVAARPVRSAIHWNGVLRHRSKGGNWSPPARVLATRPSAFVKGADFRACRTWER